MPILLLGFPQQIDDSELVFLDANWQQELPAASLTGILLDTLHTANTDAINQRRVDFAKAIRGGARIVLFAGPEVQRGVQWLLGAWLLNRMGIGVNPSGTQDIRPLVSGPLESYLRDHVAHATISGPGGSALSGSQTLGETDQPAHSAPVAVRLQKEAADVFVIPIRSLQDAASQALRLLRILPAKEDYPEYLDELQIGNEIQVRQEIEVLKNRLTELSAELEQARTAKRILYYAQIDLEFEVVRFFEEELGIPAEHVKGNQEEISSNVVDRPLIKRRPPELPS